MDSGLTAKQAADRATFLKDSNFIDHYTSIITVDMIVVNPQLSSLGNYQVVFQHQNRCLETLNPRP